MAKTIPVDRFFVESNVTIYQALELKDLILAALSRSNDLEVDLSAVSEIDGAGLQLLVMVKQEAARLGKQLRFCGHTAAVIEVIELCDLASYFGDPMVLPSH